MKEVIRLLSSAAAVIGSAVVVIALWPSSLSLVHQALERLVH